MSNKNYCKKGLINISIDTKVFVTDVDLRQRSEDDWAKMYYIQLAGDNIISVGLIDEFEWAWRMTQELNYYPLEVNGSFEKAEQMETRAQNIVHDILSNADFAEKRILKGQKRYTTTKYITNYRTGS